MIRHAIRNRTGKHSSLVAIALVIGLMMPAEAAAGSPIAQVAGTSAGSQPAAAPAYKIEILSAAGKPRKRRQNMISSESVIRVTDQNDVPVAGIAVMFSLSNLSGGSAAFANGAPSTIVTTNAAGIAATGDLTAGAASTFNISVSASVPGQPAVTASIPVNMANVAAGAGTGAAAGGAAGASAGVSGAVIGVIVAVGAAAAVGAALALGGGNGGGSTPTPTPGPTPTANPRIRIGGPGTPTVTGP